ncbi:hypothetical protein FRACYDRAFT_254840 [Fragilariopsis cylindrus CCMP1102]|uniref:Uncharacterized protein n=1 Tax=Fragilariopsis cylindrus CCMP1102 TaxID=635003 RepID=A0A1E7EKG2_9STRA|nr:hypothetical protein FRACYDRAFT_254840 [Fragilariopsis cylindrus CCMP1102]|eukprot:OEU06376.1 hypothetical protein FRACYDRAFT_254840 [Fragilariopsis cylindrus CCMP1102]
MIGHIKNIVLISYFVMVSTSIKNIIDFTNYTTAATAFYHPIADSSINNKDNVTLRSSSSLSSTTTTNTSSSLLSSSSLRDLTPMNQDQPIPAAFQHNSHEPEGLWAVDKPDLPNKTSKKTPTDYDQFAPMCRGCTLVDHDRINHRKYQGAKPDSSYLMQIHQDNVVKGVVTTNTALLGSSFGSAKQEKYDDVIYINVVPPLTVIERNVKGRLEEGKRRDRWSSLDIVIKRRQKSLLFAIKDEVLVEPLFATFQEGLAFCINTYNTYNNTVEMYI